jgi:hypothetical protein
MRRTGNWPRIRQLTARAAAAGGTFRSESGMLFSADPTIVEDVLFTHPQRYADRTAFFAVDRDRPLPKPLRREASRPLVDVTTAALPTDWTATVTRWAGDNAVLRARSWGIQFIRYALADAIARDRSPSLNSFVDFWVSHSLSRVVIEGQRAWRSRNGRQSLRHRAGVLLARETRRGGAPGDLVDIVLGIEGLTPDERGELFGHLLLAVVGATGVTLEWAMIEAPPSRLDPPAAAALISETLRLHPASWVMSRLALEDHAVGEHDVRAGEEILLLTYALHRNESVWPDPDRFDASRWHDQRDRPRRDYVPFAGGATTCPGRSVALRVLVGALVAFTERYDVVFEPGRRNDPLAYSLFAPPDGRLHLRPRVGP